MKIVDIAVKKVYRFNCPNCQSRLEADSKSVSLKIEPAMALSFYPRLKLSTQVSERHAMLIFEKIPGGKFRKSF